jgi:outer membrane protein assembly factor BamA
MKLKKRFVLLIWVFIEFLMTCVPISLMAQQNSRETDTLSNGNNTDLIDVYRNIARRTSPRINHDSSGSRNTFTILPAAGYTLQTGLTALLAANYSFTSARYPEQNNSLINATLNFSQRNQIFLISQSNIWAKNNKYFFPGEFRLMKYPQKSYGFGSKSLPSESFELDYYYLRLYGDAMIRIGKKIYAGPGYRYDNHWNITQQSTDSALTDYNHYGYAKNAVSSGPAISLLGDTRDNPINPVKGYYFKITGRLNMKAMGSDSNWQSLLLEGRKYIPIDHGSKIIALWTYNWFTTGGHAPYLDLPSLGWDGYNNTGRGYIQSRFMGNKMLYDEAEFRFRLTRNGILGAVIFGNLHSFTEWPSNKFEKINAGYGGGIRIKLNKFSGSNIAIDYGFGALGSRGLFVNLGEVF